MNYSFLVATDMDYTLLMPGTPVSDRNREACEAISKAGGAFTLSTGRTSFLTGAYTLDLNITVPIITSNGASVFDPVTRKEVYSSLIPQNITRKLIEKFFENNSNATGYSPEAIYFLPGSKRRQFIYDYNSNLPEEYKAPLGELTPDILNEKIPEFNKFLLIEPDEETLNYARSIEELGIVSSAGGFYDIMAKGISKGSGLYKVADMLGIPHDLTFALGDSENDLSMIEAAKYGVAMQNSDKRVLDAASYITTTCEEDGFAKAIFEYILPKVKSLQSGL